MKLNNETESPPVNKTSRAALATIVKKLEKLRGKISVIVAKEQDDHDNMSESCRSGDAGLATYNSIHLLRRGAIQVESATDCITMAAED